VTPPRRGLPGPRGRLALVAFAAVASTASLEGCANWDSLPQQDSAKTQTTSPTRATNPPTTPTSNPESLPTHESAPTQPQYTGPLEPEGGVWKTVDVPLGVAVGHRYSDFEMAVTGSPAVTTSNDDEYTMTSPVRFTRVREGDQSVTDDVWFTWGTPVGEPSTWSETYGRTSPVCPSEPAGVGDSVDCAVSFTATLPEIVDSTWMWWGIYFAAWPDQTVQSG